METPSSGQSPETRVPSQINDISLLSDPVRRDIFLLLRDRAEPVSREEVASALSISRELARFHLNRLEVGGLIQTSRDKPNAIRQGRGRLPRRYVARTEVLEVSVPPRNYRLLVEILLEYIRDGIDPDQIEKLHSHAFRVGYSMGVSERPENLSALAALTADLCRWGFEPVQADQPRVTLSNCPFHDAVTLDPTLICGMNLEFMRGLCTSIPGLALQPALDPAPHRCCVVFDPLLSKS